MRAELLRLAADLAERGEPFVWALVVRRAPASSAQQGDMALIGRDGAFHGWLGGSCTQPTVVREAVRALSDGQTRILALSPDPVADRRAGITALPMNCASGGSVDIYLEPVLPAPRLLLYGDSPTAHALARLGEAAGYAVATTDPAGRATVPETGRPSFVVVATMGQFDEEATLAALALAPTYLGIVASHKRFEQIRETLLARGASPETVARIKSPAGLDIGARTPEEVALSILAEIVQVRRAAEAAVASAPAVEEEQLDPVCGMTVEVAGARHSAELRGRTYYFCCGGCRERFLATPDRYAGAA